VSIFEFGKSKSVVRKSRANKECLIKLSYGVKINGSSVHVHINFNSLNRITSTPKEPFF